MNGSRTPQRRVGVVWAIDSMGVGGTELNAVRVAEELVAAGVDLTLVCLNAPGPMSERYARAGVPVLYLGLESLVDRSTVRCGFRLVDILRKRRPEVFHSHDLYSNIFALPWSRLAGVPLVMGSRRWWFGPARKSHQIANRLACRFAHCVLVNTPGLREVLANKEGTPETRSVYVPNFLEEDAFRVPPISEVKEWRRRFGLDPDRFTLGIVANLRPEKDHRSLFEALTILQELGHDVQLAVVGDGELREQLQARVTGSAVSERVVFTGHLPNRPNLHGFFDASVLCSQTEGFPNSLLEAMAMGNPVISTAVGGVSHLVTHDRHGLLVPPGNPVALASAIENVIRDPGLGRELGQRALARARSEFGRTDVIRRWLQLYGAQGLSPEDADER